MNAIHSHCRNTISAGTPLWVSVFIKEDFILDYQLEIKQIVDYPRCRIYREFIRSLMEDRDIRTNGSSYLFYYMTLCSYANFRSSYRRIEGISYLVGPGE